MRKTQRLAAVGALAALTLSIAACSNSETPSSSPTTTGGAATSSSMAPGSSSMMPSSSAMGSSASGSGVTTIKDIFGPSCSAVPTTGPGSPQGMVSDPVGTAASHNPLFTTLVKGVQAVPGLLDTLNKPDATYTVFGPVDSAFAALPPGTLDSLLKDPTTLGKVLTYHVLPMRYDAAGLVKAGTVKSVEGENVTITGTADAPLINGNPVVCGNIPTANATVFAIGKVLTVPSMAGK